MVQFRKAPLELFRRSGASLPEPNSLVLAVQPQAAIVIEFDAEVPGTSIESTTVQIKFDYRRAFGDERQTGYEPI
jgi:glucose-6-phosphate 1-dehydrogenase